MSGFQPLTPEEPTTSVVLALQASPAQPATPTAPNIAATAPVQTSPNFGAIRQLPSNILTALVSQQAVNNGNLTRSQKIAEGIIGGPAGATLAQVSAPGQLMKPGCGEFVQKLMQASPGIPFTSIASPTLMTGRAGVKNAQDLIKNVPAQCGAVTNSLINATTNLTNSGILTGKENSTQISGVVMAAATIGSSAVIAALKNPLSIASKIGGIGSKIGNAISSGTFAAGLADKLANGVSGVAASLSGLAGGATKFLSSGLNKLIGGITGGVGSALSSVGNIMQNAFNVAEQSFGSLKAGVPNNLGGGGESSALPESSTLTAVQEYEAAAIERAAAERELLQAKKAYSIEESSETYEALRAAESKAAAINQKLAQVSQKIGPGSNTQGAAGQLFGGTSAQNLAAIGSAAISGALNTPTTRNTGVNSLPGGLGAFANQVGATATNVLTTCKNIAGNLAGNVTGAIAALANPASLVGNLVSNVKGALSGIANNLTKGLGGIGGALGSTLSSAKSAISALSNAASAGVSGLLSNITSALSSFGNAPGQIKAATLAVNTYAGTRAVISSTLNSALEPKVPPPTFEIITPTFTPDEYSQAQVSAQQNLKELIAERETLTFKLDKLIDAYLETPRPELISGIDGVREEIAVVDIQIASAQQSYNRLLVS